MYQHDSLPPNKQGALYPETEVSLPPGQERRGLLQRTHTQSQVRERQPGLGWGLGREGRDTRTFLLLELSPWTRHLWLIRTLAEASLQTKNKQKATAPGTGALLPSSTPDPLHHFCLPTCNCKDCASSKLPSSGREGGSFIPTPVVSSPWSWALRGVGREGQRAERGLCSPSSKNGRTAARACGQRQQVALPEQR